MSRLIDADALEECKFHGTGDWTPVECALWQWGWNDAIDAIISNAPTVDPIKHGHWEKKSGWYWCSVCGDHWAEDGANYCPNCGAEMDEVEDGKN